MSSFRQYLRLFCVFWSAIFLIVITDTSPDAESCEEQDGGNLFLIGADKHRPDPALATALRKVLYQNAFAPTTLTPSKLTVV